MLHYINMAIIDIILIKDITLQYINTAINT